MRSLSWQCRFAKDQAKQTDIAFASLGDPCTALAPQAQPEIQRTGRLRILQSNGNAVQRQQFAGSTSQASWSRNRRPMAGLAHVAPHPCHPPATGRGFPQGCSSTVGTYEYRNHFGHLHVTHPASPTSGSRKARGVGDEMVTSHVPPQNLLKPNPLYCNELTVGGVHT